MDMICYLSPGMDAVDAPLLRQVLEENLGDWRVCWPDSLAQLVLCLDEAVLTDETLLLLMPSRMSELDDLLELKPELVRYETVIILEGECLDSLPVAHRLAPRVLLTGAVPNHELVSILGRLARRIVSRRPQYLTSRFKLG